MPAVDFRALVDAVINVANYWLSLKTLSWKIVQPVRQDHRCSSN